MNMHVQMRLIFQYKVNFKVHLINIILKRKPYQEKITRKKMLKVLYLLVPQFLHINMEIIIKWPKVLENMYKAFGVLLANIIHNFFSCEMSSEPTIISRLTFLYL